MTPPWKRRTIYGTLGDSIVHTRASPGLEFIFVDDYLSLCETNRIIINKDKFQFCQDVVQFGGLQITPTGVTPSNNLLNAISSFPSPKNITDARSWFGLVNQVAWAYSLSPIMLPFRELVKKTPTSFGMKVSKKHFSNLNKL